MWLTTLQMLFVSRFERLKCLKNLLERFLTSVLQGKKPEWGRDQLKHKDDEEKKGEEHEESEEEEDEDDDEE